MKDDNAKARRAKIDDKIKRLADKLKVLEEKIARLVEIRDAIK